MNTVLTALFLIVVPLAFNAAFFGLQRSFDYPDILRHPAEEILRRFRAGGPGLRRLWYGFAVSAMFFMPVPLLVHQVFGPAAPWFLAVGTLFGTLAGAFQVVGLLRWPFVVGRLAETYERNPGRRDAVVVVFDTLHNYAGVAIGEHLGYLCTALWSAILSLAIIATGTFPVLLGWLGLIPAIAIFIGLFEEAGFKPAAMINAIGYVLWSLWLVALGVALLF